MLAAQHIWIELVEWIRGPGDRGQGTGDILTHFDPFLLILTHFDTFTCPKFQGRVFLQEKKAPAACCHSQENGWGGGWWGVWGMGGVLGIGGGVINTDLSYY